MKRLIFLAVVLALLFAPCAFAQQRRKPILQTSGGSLITLYSDNGQEIRSWSSSGAVTTEDGFVKFTGGGNRGVLSGEKHVMVHGTVVVEENAR
jgi:hypothetical protein